MKSFIKCIIFFLILINMELSFGQDKGEDILIGKSFSIHSDVLGEERPFIIYVPRNYSEDENPVSVMYLLDGDGHFHHTSGIVSYLQDRGRIPNMMIVAIPNTGHRTRDLTPTIKLDEEAKKNMPDAGGADKMLQFISDELIPHIEKKYHTNEYKVLVGHSFGGLFAVHTFLTKPHLFDSYIAISPSLWWDKQNLFTIAQEFFKSEPELNAYFYMTMGNEDGEMLGGAMKMAALFEENKSDQFQWNFKVMKEETHGTVPLRSTYYGLEAIFKDWYRVDLSELYALGGMASVDQHYKEISDRLGDQIIASEGDINNLGYQFMGMEQFDKAIEVFDTNVNRNPDSYNVYDSRGEAYKEKGNQKVAIQDYLKSLELHPGNTNAITMLKEMGHDYQPDDFIRKMKAKEMQKYIGEYSLTARGNELILKVEAVDGQFEAVAEGTLTRQKLIAYDNHRFLAEKDNITMIFKEDDSKQIIEVKIYTGLTESVIGKRKK